MGNNGVLNEFTDQGQTDQDFLSSVWADHYKICLLLKDLLVTNFSDLSFVILIDEIKIENLAKDKCMIGQDWSSNDSITDESFDWSLLPIDNLKLEKQIIEVLKDFRGCIMIKPNGDEEDENENIYKKISKI